MLGPHLQGLFVKLKLLSGTSSYTLQSQSCIFHSKADNWNDLGTVLKKLRNISRENGLEGKMPDTKLLKTLGYGSLLQSIRKNHGGVVEVATKMGTHKNHKIVALHKKNIARTKRRKKRQEQLNQHKFYFN
ncbi:hypothetical protein CCR75_001871 [Bremia lactucae]|uniref:Uncharacterized protein n=1 Tax=Bremia lactucae TaxID=4779 RepID=A0A976ID41_BRELC|nr:hypothetical protein CCR75_001871 [Bremia lactucae]